MIMQSAIKQKYGYEGIPENKYVKLKNFKICCIQRFMRNELHNICLLSYNDISQHVCITVSDLILNSIDKIQNIKTILLFK